MGGASSGLRGEICRKVRPGPRPGPASARVEPERGGPGLVGQQVGHDARVAAVLVVVRGVHVGVLALVRLPEAHLPAHPAGVDPALVVRRRAAVPGALGAFDGADVEVVGARGPPRWSPGRAGCRRRAPTAGSAPRRRRSSPDPYCSSRSWSFLPGRGGDRGGAGRYRLRGAVRHPPRPPSPVPREPASGGRAGTPPRPACRPRPRRHGAGPRACGQSVAGARAVPRSRSASHSRGQVPQVSSGRIGEEAGSSRAGSASAGRARPGPCQPAEPGAAGEGRHGAGQQCAGPPAPPALLAQSPPEVPDTGDQVVADHAPQRPRTPAQPRAEGGEQRPDLVGDGGPQRGPQALLVRQHPYARQPGRGVRGQAAEGAGTTPKVPAARSIRTSAGRSSGTRRRMYQGPLISRQTDQR